jgi:hypothetical protein
MPKRGVRQSQKVKQNVNVHVNVGSRKRDSSPKKARRAKAKPAARKPGPTFVYHNTQFQHPPRQPNMSYAGGPHLPQPVPQPHNLVRDYTSLLYPRAQGLAADPHAPRQLIEPRPNLREAITQSQGPLYAQAAKQEAMASNPPPFVQYGQNQGFVPVASKAPPNWSYSEPQSEADATHYRFDELAADQMNPFSNAAAAASPDQRLPQPIPDVQTREVESKDDEEDDVPLAGFLTPSSRSSRNARREREEADRDRYMEVLSEASGMSPFHPRYAELKREQDRLRKRPWVHASQEEEPDQPLKPTFKPKPKSGQLGD